MIIHGEKRFIVSPFDSEAELENVVVKNAEFIFGPDSIYLPKVLIRSAQGAGTIPDGFSINLATRQWLVIEAELAVHSVWSHIAPQIAKQIIAAAQPATKLLLINLVVAQVQSDHAVREIFEDQEIPTIDIRRVLSEILEKPPTIGIPIDSVGQDLREWAQTLRNDVKLWIIRKMVELGSPQNVIYEIPEEYRPTLETLTTEVPSNEQSIASYAVTISDLIEAGFLTVGEKLWMAYKPRNGERKTYDATIESDGSLRVDGQLFSAPSYAALYYINKAGSPRQTVNGWTTWKNGAGEFIDSLRDRLVSNSRTQQK